VTKEEIKNPPKLAEWILSCVYPDKGDFTSLGDFREEYFEVYQSSGPFRANLWYWMQIAKSIPGFIRNKSHWSIVMINNYLKTALRNIKRHKGYSLINIMGLAVGMAASLLIFLYLQRELSYDMFHRNVDRIQRVLLLDKNLGTNAGINYVAMAPEIPKNIPEVEEAVRIMQQGHQKVKVGEKRFYTRAMALADASIFKIFDFDLAYGDPSTALQEPYTAVLTQDLAKILFAGENPMGKTFIWGSREIKVTGLLADIPDTSHLQFDVLVSLNFPHEKGGLGERLRSWGWVNAPTYILLREGADTSSLEGKLIALLRKNGIAENFTVTHQPLKDIHLRSKNISFDSHNQNKGDVGHVYSLAAVAFFIILIAVFNFMNLSTARSHKRAREVGIRKVVGAKRKQLIWLFLGESLLLCLSGLVIALGLAALGGALLNSAYGTHLNLNVLIQLPTAAEILTGAVIIGLLGGIWPALALSSFYPKQVLRDISQRGGYNTWLRRTLVIVQFAISIALIVCSAVIYKQMHYIKNKDLGYDRSEVLTLFLDEEARASFEPLLEKLAQSPAILSWSASGRLPGRTIGRVDAHPEGWAQTDPWNCFIMSIDEYFIETLGLELIEGRNFSHEFGTEAEKAVIINQTAASSLGWDNPIGKTFENGQFRVVGLVKDFHFATLHHKVEPLVMSFLPGANVYLSLKLQADVIPKAIEHLQGVWKELFPGSLLEFSFLDDEFDQLYRREQSFGSLSRGFTLLAIFIACLGLFGLASNMAEQRTKEIGIRKVLGAGVGELVILFSKTFLKLVLLANLLAWPAGYFLMRRWLQDFVYQIDLDFGIFLLSMLAALCIALLTVSYHSVKAATANPVDSLRYE
jgi:putative ABC transport system permease protein